MDIAEVIAQLSSQAVAKGTGAAFCIDTANGDQYEIMDINWDDETNSHVIEIQPYE